MNDHSRKVVPALPASTQELLAMRKAMQDRTIIDHVEDIHVALWPDQDYRRALEAAFDRDAIEGSLMADNFVAAGMIREYARAKDHPFVRDQKLAVIVKALSSVLRRYKITRNERALAAQDLFEVGRP